MYIGSICFASLRATDASKKGSSVYLSLYINIFVHQHDDSMNPMSLFTTSKKVQRKIIFLALSGSRAHRHEAGRGGNKRRR